MTLISRGQMPPRTPYEADLRGRLERLQGEMDLLRRMAGAQRPVVESARSLLVHPITGTERDDLRSKLNAFDQEIGKILLDSMPLALREGLTAPGAAETGSTVSLFPAEMFEEKREAEKMVHTIWKFPVRTSDTFIMDLPTGAKFLDLQVQHGAPQAWFLLDPNAPKQQRRFVLVGTGHPVPETEKLTHLGTFQIQDGQLVFHLFEYDAPGY